jgi:hypothetical protein
MLVLVLVLVRVVVVVVLVLGFETLRGGMEAHAGVAGGIVHIR